MLRNTSLPQIQHSFSKNSNNSNSAHQSPLSVQNKKHNRAVSSSQLNFIGDDFKSAFYPSQLKFKKQTISESKLPTLQQKSVVEMQQQIQQHDNLIKQKINREEEEVTTILLQDNQLIIQPKFFEKKGSMCTTDLWSGCLKKEFLNFSQQEILVNSNGKKKLKLKKAPKNNRNGNMQDVEKLLANIYRPEKMKNQAEMNRVLEDLKQGVQITKQSIDQQIKNYENRTPLDIKIRISEKQKTMMMDANQDEDGLNHLPQIQKDKSLRKIEEQGIQEVEDERFESSPMNKLQDGTPQYYSDAVDQIEAENKQLKPKYGNVQFSDAEEDKRTEKTNKINIKSNYYQFDSKEKKTLSVPKFLNKSNNCMNFSKFDQKLNQSKKGILKISSEKEIISLNNIPTQGNDDSYDYDDDFDGSFSGRNKNDQSSYYFNIGSNSSNPEMNGYVNIIKNVIEGCNQTLETNSLLEKQIKKHTYKLNNRSKNFQSVSNLEKRIESSTIF